MPERCFTVTSLLDCGSILRYVFREDQRVSHYIINKLTTDTGSRFRIGDQDFPDIPSLLNFYKTHYLDTTSLIRPAEKEVIRVIAKFDFDGKVSHERRFSHRLCGMFV